MICEQVSDSYLRKANANTPSPRVSTPKIESTIKNSSLVMRWTHFIRRARSIEIGFPISLSESVGTTEPRYANGSCRTKSTIPRMVGFGDRGGLLARLDRDGQPECAWVPWLESQMSG